MIAKTLKFGKQKGSSLSLPANGLGGSRATSFLLVRQLRWHSLKPCRKKSGPAIQRDKLRRKAKGQKGRGFGGRNFCPFAI